MDNIIILMGMLVSILKNRVSIRIDRDPASCDQKIDLTGPICLANIPPRKSYILHTTSSGVVLLYSHTFSKVSRLINVASPLYSYIIS